MIDENKVLKFCDLIDSQTSKVDSDRLLAKAMLNFLEHARDVLPDIAKRSLETANLYWIRREISGDELDACRVRCWNYLDSIGKSIDIDSPVVASVRSVICVLHPEFNDSTYQILDWFIWVFSQIGLKEDLSHIIDVS